MREQHYIPEYSGIWLWGFENLTRFCLQNFKKGDVEPVYVTPLRTRLPSTGCEHSAKTRISFWKIIRVGN